MNIKKRNNCHRFHISYNDQDSDDDIVTTFHKSKNKNYDEFKDTFEEFLVEIRTKYIEDLNNLNKKNIFNKEKI